MNRPQEGKTELPADPTVYRPMKVIASRELPVGFALEPVTFKVTLDKMRLFEYDWPWERNIHNDYDAAHREAFRKPIVAGNHLLDNLGDMLIRFFGAGYVQGGTISVRVVHITEPGDELMLHSSIREKIVEGDIMRLVLDVQLVNQRGEKVLFGTASGLVR